MLDTQLPFLRSHRPRIDRSRCLARVRTSEIHPVDSLPLVPIWLIWLLPAHRGLHVGQRPAHRGLPFVGQRSTVAPIRCSSRLPMQKCFFALICALLVMAVGRCKFMDFKRHKNQKNGCQARLGQHQATIFCGSWSWAARALHHASVALLQLCCSSPGYRVVSVCT